MPLCSLRLTDLTEPQPLAWLDAPDWEALRRSLPSSEELSAAPGLAGNSSNEKPYAASFPTNLIDPSGLDPFTPDQNQLFSDALGILSRADGYGSSPYYSALANLLSDALKSGAISIDPTTGHLKGEDNAVAVTANGSIRLNPSLFQSVFPCKTKQGKLERLQLAATLASILLHEFGHIQNPSLWPGFEVPRYQSERVFFQALLGYERQQVLLGNESQARYDAIYQVAQQREDQGYNQGAYGGNLSGPRMFP